MSLSKSIVNADRAAIRQVLAILEEEGVVIEDNDIEFPFNMNIDEGLKIRHNPALSSRKATRRVSWSPIPTKGLLRNPGRMNISPVAFLPEIPVLDSEIQETVSITDDLVIDKPKRRSQAKRSKHPHTHKSKQEDNANSSSVKSVRFSEYEQINHIPHIDDFSKEETDQRWMNEEEYHFIRSRSYKLINMMEDVYRYPVSADTMIVNKHRICVRGLEGKTSQKQNESDQLQKRIHTAVFHLQQQQKEDGLVDPQALRQVSTKYSKYSTKSARFVGISDEVKSLSKRYSF